LTCTASISLRRLHVDGRCGKGGKVHGVEAQGPDLPPGRVEDEHAETILELADRRFGDDQLLLVRRHFGLRGEQIQRGRLPDVHLDLVDTGQFLGERKRRAARLDVGPSRDEVPVGRLRGGCRVDDALPDARVGDVAADLRLRELQARGVHEQVADERLGDADGQPRSQQRIVAVEDAVAVSVRRVPRDAVRGAEPGKPLAQPDVR
jgi:hypothetical protein